MEKWKAALRRMIYRFYIFLRRKVKPPGFQGMGLYDVLKFLLRGLTDSKFTLLAAAMAYNFFFSLFPLLFLVFTLLPSIIGADTEAQLMDYVEQFVPGDGLHIVKDIIDDFFERQGVGLISLNIFLVFWGATRGVIAMMRSFTKNAATNEIFKNRNVLQLYGTAWLILLVLVLLFLVSVGALAAGRYAIYLLDPGAGVARLALQGLNVIITLILLFFSVSTIYYLAPAMHQRWKFITPGSVVSGVLILLTLIGFGYFFTGFGTQAFNKIYGSLAAIILLMIWFYYISLILLIGFELNASIDLAYYHRGELRLRYRTPKEPPEHEAAGQGSSDTDSSTL